MDYNALVVNVVVTVALLGGILLTLLGLPGNTAIFLIAAGYGYYDHFVHLTVGTVFILLGAFIVGEIVEFLFSVFGAKKENASKWAIQAAFFGTVVGSILGTMVLPLIGSFFGSIIGGFTATYLAEYRRTGNREIAKRVAVSVIKGQILGTMIKIAIAIGMVILTIAQLQW
jgi:hypothetical protein